LSYDHNLSNIGLVEEESVKQIDKRGRVPEIFFQQLDNQLLLSRNRLYFNGYKLQMNVAYQNNKLEHIGQVDEHEVEMRLRTLTYETKLYLPSDPSFEYIVGFQGMNQWNNNLNNRENKLLPDAVLQNYSLFGLLQHTFFSKFIFQGGVRYDRKLISTQAIGDASVVDSYRPSIEKSFGSLSGSLGATYNVNESLLFRTNIAAAYRTPTLAELTSNGQHEERFEIGDASLRPENAYEMDISMHLHHENFTFDLAGFYNYICNYIFLSPTGVNSAINIPIYKYNQSNAYLYGGEADFNINPATLSWLHFRTNFSYVIGKKNNQEYLPFIPAHKITTEIRVEKKTLAFFHDAFALISTHSALAQHHPAPNEATTSGYTLVDSSIGAVLKTGRVSIALQFGVNNLFDIRYVDHLSTLKEVGFFNPGRNMVSSIKISF
jgi:iron complex outermembrane receptor protein